MIDLSRREVEVALKAAAAGGRLARTVQQEMTRPALAKADESPVTVGDFAVQAVVAKILYDSFPDLPLVAEEDSRLLDTPEGAATLERVTEFVRRVIPDAESDQVCRWIDYGTGEPAGRFWTLDPIDGTKGFLRGDQYVVALALIAGSQVQIGVLACPNLNGGCLALAVRGEGSWKALLNDGEKIAFERLQVSDRQDPAEARVVRSFESGHTDVEQFATVIQAIGVRTDPLLMDSQAKYVVLAEGEGDLLLRLLSRRRQEYRECIWDQAAGSLVVQEARGRVTDLDGRPLDFSAGRRLSRNRGVLASNGFLHNATLEALKSLR